MRPIYFLFHAILVLIGGVVALGAQTSYSYSAELGDITEEEWAMTSCSFDSSASAVVLFDHGYSDFAPSKDRIYIEHRRHKRIKIFDEGGFDYGSVTIPYYTEKSELQEEILSLKAYTYVKENGKVSRHELQPEDVYEERINQWRSVTKFVFPNVQEGAILEYVYVLNSPYYFRPPSWKFQSSIPTLKSTLQVGLAPFYEYVELVQGIDQFDVYSAKTLQERRYYGDIEFFTKEFTYGLTDIPAFGDESYITTIEDYIKKVEFQLSRVHRQNGIVQDVIPTWEKLNEELLDQVTFGGYIKGSRRFAKKFLEEMDLEGLSKAEIGEKVINAVKNSFYWNDYYGKFADQDPRDFYLSRTGSAPEINLFLIAVLREAGINAEPLLISTRDYGKVTMSYPLTSKFNYVIALINDEDFVSVADATTAMIGHNMIPTRCINGYGLLISKTEANQWYNLEYARVSEDVNNINIEVLPEQKLCNMKYIWTGSAYVGYLMRSSFGNDTTEIKEHFSEYFDEVSDIQTRNFKKPTKPYAVAMEAQKDVEVISDFLVVKPFFDLDLTENPLNTETREYPVDMIFPRKNVYKVNLKIPLGYSLDSSPEEINIEDELVAIHSSSQLSPDESSIRIVSDYTFKKAVYMPQEYEKLKAHMDTIVGMFAQELVLKSTE